MFSEEDAKSHCSSQGATFSPVAPVFPRVLRSHRCGDHCSFRDRSAAPNLFTISAASPQGFPYDTYEDTFSLSYQCSSHMSTGETVFSDILTTVMSGQALLTLLTHHVA